MIRILEPTVDCYRYYRRSPLPDTRNFLGDDWYWWIEEINDVVALLVDCTTKPPEGQSGFDLERDQPFRQALEANRAHHEAAIRDHPRFPPQGFSAQGLLGETIVATGRCDSGFLADPSVFRAIAHQLLDGDLQEPSGPPSHFMGGLVMEFLRSPRHDPRASLEEPFSDDHLLVWLFSDQCILSQFREDGARISGELIYLLCYRKKILVSAYNAKHEKNGLKAILGGNQHVLGSRWSGEPNKLSAEVQACLDQYVDYATAYNCLKLNKSSFSINYLNYRRRLARMERDRSVADACCLGRFIDRDSRIHHQRHQLQVDVDTYGPSLDIYKARVSAGVSLMNLKNSQYQRAIAIWSIWASVFLGLFGGLLGPWVWSNLKPRLPQAASPGAAAPVQSGGRPGGAPAASGNAEPKIAIPPLRPATPAAERPPRPRPAASSVQERSKADDDRSRAFPPPPR